MASLAVGDEEVDSYEQELDTAFYRFAVVPDLVKIVVEFLRYDFTSLARFLQTSKNIRESCRHISEKKYEKPIWKEWKETIQLKYSPIDCRNLQELFSES